MKETPRCEGAGQGESLADSPDTAPDLQHQDLIDPRLALLACASARLMMVEQGVISLDEALDHHFIERFRSVAGVSCHCEREMIDRWSRLYPHRPSFRR